MVYRTEVFEPDVNLFDEPTARRLLESLTDAQVEVLDRVLLHKTSKEIARELGIAPNTVDQRIKAVWPKLGTYDRASTARRYALLKTICGLTTYGQPVIDFGIDTNDISLQEMPEGPLFIVEDSATFSPSYWQRPPTFLETLDVKFGRFGRILAIVLGALSLAITGLVITAMAVTMGSLV